MQQHASYMSQIQYYSCETGEFGSLPSLLGIKDDCCFRLQRHAAPAVMAATGTNMPPMLADPV